MDMGPPGMVEGRPSATSRLYPDVPGAAGRRATGSHLSSESHIVDLRSPAMEYHLSGVPSMWPVSGPGNILPAGAPGEGSTGALTRGTGGRLQGLASWRDPASGGPGRPARAGREGTRGV